MSGSREESPGEDYFNDLSQQPSGPSCEAGERRGSQEDSVNGQVPKPKRIACVLCRKRKLRCDGNKPSCGTCTRLQHDCSYDEVRRKSGPKRGYVKALEARLAQVETLLNKQDEEPVQKGNGSANGRVGGNGGAGNGMVPEYENISVGASNVDFLPHIERVTNRHDGPQQAQFPNTVLGIANGDFTSEEPFPWEMIGLGLDEPLPTQDVVDELNKAYFEKIHPSLPMIHRARYYAAMNLAPHMRPPVCMRYAMWCNAAAVTPKYEQLQEHFYLRARKYIQQDEMKGHGESMITVAHSQTWILLATYEFKLMYFPRAWMSAGRACRMVQMMGLHRLDGAGLDVKQCLPPPKDWTEREERRRTFWMAFCVDRYSSIGTGWPMTIDEQDIMTSLPGDEECFEFSRPPAKTMNLEDALDPDNATGLSGYGGVILMACLFGRNLTHLHRPSPNDADDDLNGEFWRRHRGMDNILLSTALSLPDSLRLPSGLNDPNIVFFNMCIHTSTICLHQAAIFKADKNRMPARIAAESKVRCITAAAEIASVMRQISHLDLSAMNPFISFCLYVAARVFVQYLKSRPKDTQIMSSLQFLLSAMQAVKRKNPLTESFLVQLDVDLEAAGLHEAAESIRKNMSVKLPGMPIRSEGCPVSQMGVGEGKTPNYDDVGHTGYSECADGITITATAPDPSSTFTYENLTPMSAENGMGFVPSMNQYDLPVRSPASNQGSGMHRSPQSLHPDMDTSPDGSGGGHHTPNSSTQSQQNMSAHTSHTGYSPQNLHQPDSSSNGIPSEPGRLTGPSLFDPNDGAFTTEFDMHGFSNTTIDNQQQGFVLPSNWGTGSTGFTPGPSGLTPGPSGISDMMGMTDADWNQMMNNMNFNEWEGVGNSEIQGMAQGRRL